MLGGSQILTYNKKYETNVCCRETHSPSQHSAVHSGGLLHRGGPRSCYGKKEEMDRLKDMLDEKYKKEIRKSLRDKARQIIQQLRINPEPSLIYKLAGLAPSTQSSSRSAERTCLPCNAGGRRTPSTTRNTSVSISKGLRNLDALLCAIIIPYQIECGRQTRPERVAHCVPVGLFTSATPDALVVDRD